MGKFINNNVNVNVSKQYSNSADGMARKIYGNFYNFQSPLTLKKEHTHKIITDQTIISPKKLLPCLRKRSTVQISFSPDVMVILNWSMTNVLGIIFFFTQPFGTMFGGYLYIYIFMTHVIIN